MPIQLAVWYSTIDISRLFLDIQVKFLNIHNQYSLGSIFYFGLEKLIYFRFNESYFINFSVSILLYINMVVSTWQMQFILHCFYSFIKSLLKTIMPGIYLCETVNIMHDAKTNKLPEMELTEGLKLNRDEKLCCNRPCTSRC